jgi:hypothetical protein
VERKHGFASQALAQQLHCGPICMKDRPGIIDKKRNVWEAFEQRRRVQGPGHH